MNEITKKWNWGVCSHFVWIVLSVFSCVFLYFILTSTPELSPFFESPYTPSDEFSLGFLVCSFVSSLGLAIYHFFWLVHYRLQKWICFNK